MKKILMVLLMVVSLFVVSSCVNESNEELDDGAFYGLRTAYNVGFLSKSDLLDIQDTYSKGENNISHLSDSVKEKIKEAKVNDLKITYDASGREVYPDATIDGVHIIGFYGMYNNCYALIMDSDYWDYPAVITTDVIDGVTFVYPDTNRIIIYKTNKPHLEDEAKEAYLETIIKKYREDAHIDEVLISGYIGTFDDSYVAEILDKLNTVFLDVVVPLVINELDFSHSMGYIIYVYNNGKIYYLNEAFSLKIITEEQLKQIHDIYRHIY